MTVKFLIIPFFALSMVLVSCGGSSEEQKNQESIDGLDSVSANPDSALIVDDNEVSYNLPSALQIAYVFKKSGAGFIPTLLNNKANSSKYNTSNYKRAVNFGIYSADLAYCLFNKKYQESKEYLKACKEMGSFLGLNQAFESDNMAQRFDKNIANEDSVVKIVSNVQLKTDLMFEQNKQKHITVVAFAGAWTESMYIAVEAYAKDKNKKVLASLMEQLLLSETIIKDDAEIRIALSGEAFDPTRLRSTTGFFDSATNSIVWTKNELETLATVQPGQSGRLSFRISPRAINTSGTLDVAISIKGTLFGGKEESIIDAVTGKIGISTDLQIIPKVLYHSGPLQNTGPMPMKVGKETTFTVIWQLSNSVNPATGVTVKTTLPTGIVWKNVVSPVAQSGEISYNSVTRELVWNPNDVAVGQNIKTIAFKLAVTPSTSQIGSVVGLTNGVTLTGTDSITQTSLFDEKRGIDSRLSNDTSKVGADGKVLR